MSDRLIKYLTSLHGVLILGLIEEILRFAQDDRTGAKGLVGAPMVMAPLSQESGSRGREILRCAQDDSGGGKGVAGGADGPTFASLRWRAGCERGEGTGWVGREILRCAQGDRAVLPAALRPTMAHVRLGLMTNRPDKSAVIGIKLSKSPSTSVGAREVGSGREGQVCNALRHVYTHFACG